MMHFDPDKEVIENPTWYEHIRYFFTQKDISEMKKRGVNLDDKNEVEEKYFGISTLVVLKKTARMVMPPAEENRRWSENRVKTFNNWQGNNYEWGQAPILQNTRYSNSKPATRIRKEIRDLNTEEKETLKKAFLGIMNRPATEVNSYFTLAGMHGLPVHPDKTKWHDAAAKKNCAHRVPRYHLWHRAYLYNFENALRSVKGCEEVTLPYWDFENTSTFPDIFNEAPFDKYTLPFDLREKPEPDSKPVLPEYKKGYTTCRVDSKELLNRFKKNVVPFIKTARKGKTFNAFRDSSTGVIQAHDWGHYSFGNKNQDDFMSTMRDSAVAAFDPIFWFFHCNWDKLWWEWQEKMGATTAAKMLTTITYDKTDPHIKKPFANKMPLPPFSGKLKDEHLIVVKSTDIVDSLNQLNVDYYPKRQEDLDLAPLALGSISTKKLLPLDTQNVSIRVRGVNKIKINGSFLILLKTTAQNSNKEETIGKLALFQTSTPEMCENCVENAIINFDFNVPISTIKNKVLSVHIVSSDTEEAHKEALKGASINTRLLFLEK